MTVGSTAGLKIGLGPSINRVDPAGPVASQIDAMVATAQIARQAGFGYLSAGHHWLSPGFLNPLLCFARLIPAVADLDFHTSVFLLPQHNPFDMADQIATLDVLSRGRLVLGVGLGYRDLEFAAAGIPKSERVARLNAAIAIMRALWRGEVVDREGPLYPIQGAVAGVLTCQKPGVPILLGTQNAQGARRAGRTGDGWILWGLYRLSAIRAHYPLYREARSAAAKAGAGLIELKRYVHIAPTRGQAIAEARTYMEGYWNNAFYQSGGLAESGKVALDLPWEQVARERAVIGTPDQVVETLQALIDEFQVSRLALSWKQPDWTLRQYHEACMMLGRSVLPHLKPFDRNAAGATV